MGIATDVKKLGEDIVASHDLRVEAIGTLVKDTHKMLKGFRAEHKEMAAQQAKALADFVKDLAKDVGAMMGAITRAHKEMADKLKADLAKGEGVRLKDFKAMMGGIQKGVKEIETYVKNKLKEFSDAHADMSEELKKELAKYVADMVKATRKLMGDIQARQKERNAEVADLLEAFKTEREKMAANWQALTDKMAKRRGIKPKIEAKVEVKEVKEAIEAVKPKKGEIEKAKPKKRGKKRGRKKKREGYTFF